MAFGAKRTNTFGEADINPKLKASLVPVSTFLSGTLLGAAGGMYVSGLSTPIAASVAGGLLAAGAALIGVAVNNKSQSERHAEQLAHDSARQHLGLEHDRSLKRIEREMQFRKELYADAVGAGSEIVAGLNEFVDPKIDLAAVTQPMAARRVLLNKALLVCDDETTNYIHDFTVETAKAIVTCSEHHNALRKLHLEADGLVKLTEDYYGRARAALDRRTAGVHESIPPQNLELLKQEQEGWSQLANELHRKTIAAHAKTLAAMRERAPAIQASGDAVAAALHRLTTSMKRELGEATVVAEVQPTNRPTL